jgi:RNA polymerase sigma factor (sigma-70 family)
MSEADELAALAGCAMRGDDQAWATLAERVRPRLFAYAVWRLSGDAQSADDAVQEAMLLAQRGITGLRDARAIMGWLRMLVQRRCLRFSRVDIVSQEPIDVEVDEDPSRDLSTGEQAVVVESALARLSAADRNILNLAYAEGLAPAAIASLLGVPAGTVRKRLFDARTRLRPLLSQFSPERL